MLEDIKFGFEIETQNSGDGKPDSLCASDYEDDLISDVEDYIQNLCRSDIRSAVRSYIRSGYDFTVDIESIWNSLEERILDNWDSDEAEDIRDSSECRQCWWTHTDGTVNGYEYVFANAMNYEESKKAIQCFPWGDAEIDEKCSCHVHVSWNGIKTNTYRQVRLYEALVKNLANASQELRDIVKERLDNKDWCTNYYAPCLGDARYLAIAKRDKGNGTYEFRLFGYVQTEAVALEVLELVQKCAIDADNDATDKESLKKIIDAEPNYLSRLLAACEGQYIPMNTEKEAE